MADNDYNMIKPVETLQNIGSLTPAQRREERKRQQQNSKEKESEQEQDNQAQDQENTNSRVDEVPKEKHSIDYCA